MAALSFRRVSSASLFVTGVAVTPGWLGAAPFWGFCRSSDITSAPAVDRAFSGLTSSLVPAHPEDVNQHTRDDLCEFTDHFGSRVAHDKRVLDGSAHRKNADS